MKKRILALIMSMLLIVCTLLTLASCVGEKDPDDSSDPEFVKDWYDNLGKHDLKGYTVKFAVAETDGDGFHKRSIVAEEGAGDAVDAAVFARNEAIEARFNCNIELTFYTDVSNLSTSLSTVFMSGGKEYDVIAARQWDDISICSKGFVLDLAKNEYTSQYLEWQDNKFPYWAEDYIDGMSYKGQVYWLTGDLCLRYTGGFYCTFVNASIYEEVLQNNGAGNIYDIVREKRWTIDKMREFSDAVTTVENTTIEELVGSGGIIGVACPVWDNTNGWAVAAGVNFSEKNKDGSINLTFNEKNTTLDAFYSKYMQLLGSKGVLQTGKSYVDAFKAFSSNNALIVPGKLNHAERYLREMPSNYYIIPCPLLNEGENYRSTLPDGINIYGISVGSENIEATAIVLEAMCAESYRSVRPEYYDNALKFKYTTDFDSADMIDILSESAYMDFALVWGPTTYFSGLAGFLRHNMSAGVSSITSQLKKQRSVWSKGIEDLDKIFMDLAKAQ